MEIRRNEQYGGILEVRAAGAEGTTRTIAGLAVPYGVWSQDLGGFREMFAVGAVRESLAEDDIAGVNNHDSSQILGWKSTGTLTLTESDRGVDYEVEPPDTQWARELMHQIERKDIRGNSFGFQLSDYEQDQRWEERDGILWRTITRARIRELGPQPFPAYGQTSAQVNARSIRSVMEEGLEWLQRRGHPVDLLRRRLDLDEEDARAFVSG